MLGTAIRSGVALRRSVLLLAMLAVGACGDDNGDPGHTPGNLTIVSGNTQTVVSGSTAAQPFVVTLVNKNGSPMEGVTISWTVVPAASGTMAFVATQTDANGQAKGTYQAVAPTGITGVTAGTPVAAGSVTINALASGLPAVPFTVTVTK